MIRAPHRQNQQQNQQRYSYRIVMITTMLFVFWLACGVHGQDARSVAALRLEGAIRDVHDPSITKEGNTYYLFSTGANILLHCSPDLHTWTSCGTVFASMPIWAVEDIPAADSIWAPDISYFNGAYYLYYAVSTFGSNRSDIGLATNQTLDPNSTDYQWVDKGKVLESNHSDSWNAIDPNLIVDAQGQPWLALGSFWSGLKLVKLDPATGKPLSEHPKLYSLARRPSPDALEASFIVYRDGYYYLFASFDFCCRGVNSTYNVRVGRSRSVTGPYADEQGTPMLQGGGTLLITETDRWRGPGGESILHDGSRWWIVYHAYDAELAGAPTLRINPIRWRADGWPETMSPETPSENP